MWPPMRSVGRSASSRLTALPGSRPPSDVFASVWFITSASKAPPSTRAAVRQTPLTATESLSARSPASRVRTRSRAPSAPESIASTLPTSAMRPVNNSPLPQARLDEHVVAYPLDAGVERARGVGDRGGAPPLDHGARAASAKDDRRDEEREPVDLSGVEERARERRPALEQDARDLAPPELVERRLDSRRPLASHGHDLGARRLECCAAVGVRCGTGDDDEGGLVDRPHEGGVERKLGMRVEDDPRR